MLTVLMNSPALSDETNPLVRGEGVPIMAARFLVAPDAAPGSHAAAVSLTVESMINFMTNMFVKGAPGVALDARDGADASGGGAIEVEAAEVRGLFAYAEGGVASLQNSAPLTGVAVSQAIRTATVSSRPGATPAAPASSTCTSEGGITSGALAHVSGCVAQASAAATAGGPVAISVSAQGFTLSLTLKVWHPSPISLHLEAAPALGSTVLHRIAGCGPTSRLGVGLGVGAGAGLGIGLGLGLA